MSDQTSIFGNTPSDTNPNPTGGSNPPNTNVPDDVATILGSIKNERGEVKYKDLNTALQALQASQEFIPTLKSQYETEKAEAQRLREEVARLRTIEDTVAALTQRQAEQTGTPPATGRTDEEIAELVNRTLTQKEQKATAMANVQSVVSTLQQSFGADAEKKFYDKAQEMGMSVDEMNALAAKSPKAVLSMLGVTVQQAHKPNVSATNSSVNTSAFQPTQETFVGRNTKPTLVGATSQDLKMESQAANKMVEELHAQGMSVHDLTDPKLYAKYILNTNRNN
jgi:hypothetical protein